MVKPRTIHDFGGFPQALFEVQYPSPGSPWLAQEVQNTMKKIKVGLDQDWGLDHGCWSVLTQMFPAADIPVVQLSLDDTRPASEHYDLAKELAPLQQKGVLIVLALKQENETVIYFNDQPVGGSLTMTSLIIDAECRNAQYARQMPLGSN